MARSTMLTRHEATVASALVQDGNDIGIGTSAVVSLFDTANDCGPAKRLLAESNHIDDLGKVAKG